MDPNNNPRQAGFHTGKSFNKRMILPAILRNWYWFLLAGAVGFGVAFVLRKVFPGSYRSTMTILLINSPRQSPFTSSLDNNLEIQENPINVQDEQTVLSAYSLQLQTLQNPLVQKVDLRSQGHLQRGPIRGRIYRGLRPERRRPAHHAAFHHPLPGPVRPEGPRRRYRSRHPVQYRRGIREAIQQ